MFKFKILATGFLTMVLGAGVAVGVAATNQHTVDRVDAETIQSPNGKRAILWEDNWTKASKGMYIHYWGGSESSDWNSKPKMLKSEKRILKDNIFITTISHQILKISLYTTLQIINKLLISPFLLLIQITVVIGFGIIRLLMVLIHVLH